MTAIFVAAVVAAVLLFVLVKRQAGDSRSAGPWPFAPKKPLTAPEQVLYFRMLKALPDHIVLAQVGLSRFLSVKRGHDFRAWNNRINRMSVDFLVCAKDCTILAAIELDDSSHQRSDRATADAKKDKALEAAGIRLVRWQVKALPDDLAIRRALDIQAPALTDRAAA